MKALVGGLFLLAGLATLGTLSGCATQSTGIEDAREYSDMPWNTPQQWEGSRQLPGMPNGGY